MTDLRHTKQPCTRAGHVGAGAPGFLATTNNKLGKNGRYLNNQIFA